MKIILPLVHLNGSGKRSLLDQQQEIHSALDTVLSKMSQARPHMRDYYPMEDGAAKFKLAQEQAALREKIVSDLQTEIMSIWNGIEDGKREVE